jgi:hypothetical protein
LTHHFQKTDAGGVVFVMGLTLVALVVCLLLLEVVMVRFVVGDGGED